MKERRLQRTIEKVLDSSSAGDDVVTVLELVKHQDAY
jgi:hypothetical protein